MEVLLAVPGSTVLAMHAMENAVGLPVRRPSLSAVDFVAMNNILYFGFVHTDKVPLLCQDLHWLICSVGCFLQVQIRSLRLYCWA